jgi:hypothetical protein
MAIDPVEVRSAPGWEREQRGIASGCMSLLRRLSPVVAAGALAAVAPSAAPAAPPWSEPQVVAGGYLARWEPGPGGIFLRTAPGQLGFTPGGTGFAILGRSAGGLGYARFSGPSNAFGAMTASAFGGIEPFDMALYGRSGVILGGAAARSSDRRAPSNGALLDAAATRGNVTGTFSTRQILVRGVLLQPDRRFGQPAVVTAVAANPAGDAAVTVSYPVLSRRRTTVVGFRNRLFIRPRGGTAFRRELDYGRQTVGSSPSALAINGPGDVLLAWDDRKAVRARLISSRGDVGAEQRLGTGGSPWIGATSTRIVASIDSTRRMLVAWLAQRAGSSGNAGGPGIVAAAVASPGRPFGRQQTLEANLPRGDGTLIRGTAVQAALLRDRSVVTWTGAESGRFVVRTADIVSGRAGASTRLSAPGVRSELQGMTVGPRGGALRGLAQRHGDAGPLRVGARRRHVGLGCDRDDHDRGGHRRPGGPAGDRCARRLEPGLRPGGRPHQRPHQDERAASGRAVPGAAERPRRALTAVR